MKISILTKLNLALLMTTKCAIYFCFVCLLRKKTNAQVFSFSVVIVVVIILNSNINLYLFFWLLFISIVPINMGLRFCYLFKYLSDSVSKIKQTLFCFSFLVWFTLAVVCVLLLPFVTLLWFVSSSQRKFVFFCLFWTVYAYIYLCVCLFICVYCICFWQEKKRRKTNWKDEIKVKIK
jgi:hypothetical protein